MREDLANVKPSHLVPTLPNYTAFIRSRIEQAGIDREEIRAWREEVGGYVDWTPAIRSNALGGGPTIPPEEFYAVPNDALRGP